MTELKKYTKNEFPTEEQYYEQLELNFQIHKLEIKKKKLRKRIDKLEKINRKYPLKDFSEDFMVIKALVNEVNENHKKALSKIREEYYFNHLVEKLKKTEEYAQNIKKALRKGLINVNTHRVTSSYYSKQKSQISEQLRRLKILTESYTLLLTNQKIELNAEKEIIKRSRSKRIEIIGNSEKSTEIIDKKINQIDEKIRYFSRFNKE